MTLGIFGATIALAASDGSLGDSNIKYFGRWDFSSPEQYVSYWGGAYIKVNFSGTTVKIRLGNTSNFYYKIDNGAWTTLTSVVGAVNLTPNPLARGTHTLSVAQGKDYDYVFNFQGLILDVGATTSSPTVSSNLIEFIGDSITDGGQMVKGLIPYRINHPTPFVLGTNNSLSKIFHETSRAAFRRSNI